MNSLSELEIKFGTESKGVSQVRGGSRIFLRRGAPLRNGVTDW